MFHFHMISETAGQPSVVAVPAELAIGLEYHLRREGLWHRVYNWQDILKGAAPLSWENAQDMLRESFPGEDVPVLIETFFDSEELLPELCFFRESGEMAASPEAEQAIAHRFDVLGKFGRWKAAGQRKSPKWVYRKEPFRYVSSYEGFLAIFDGSVGQKEILEILGERSFTVELARIQDILQPVSLVASAVFIAVARIDDADGTLQWDGYRINLDPRTGVALPETLEEEEWVTEIYSEELTDFFSQHQEDILFFHRKVRLEKMINDFPAFAAEVEQLQEVKP